MTLLLDEQIVAIERALARAGIPHAFGGAQALAYYGPVRATHDIDLNVFVPVARAAQVLGVLAELGADAANPGLLRLAERDGQVRVRWEGTPIDVFFAYDALHRSSMERRRQVDFHGDRIHVLSAEDLIVYKAAFDRAKDWEDIAGIVFASPEPLDLDYCRRWLERIEGREGPRLARLERVVGSGGRELG